ncbi:MAG: hypothetical protein LBH76_07985 [Propionibacteriaceae bacterium]|nr:hypothetical protein [Propionibacteriaceae bacterium]
MAQAAGPEDPFCVVYETEMSNFASLQDELAAAFEITGVFQQMDAAALALEKIIAAFDTAYAADPPAGVKTEMADLLTLFRGMHTALVDRDIDTVDLLMPQLMGEEFEARTTALNASVVTYCETPLNASDSPSPSAPSTADPTEEPTESPSPSPSAAPTEPSPSAEPTEPEAAPSPTNQVKQTPYCTTFQTVGAQLANKSGTLDNIGQAQATLNEIIPLLRQLLAADPPPEIAPTISELTNLFTRVKTALDVGDINTLVEMQAEIEAAGPKVEFLRDRSMTECNITDLPNTGSGSLTTPIGVASLVALGVAGLSGIAASNYRRQSALSERR